MDHKTGTVATFSQCELLVGHNFPVKLKVRVLLCRFAFDHRHRVLFGFVPHSPSGCNRGKTLGSRRLVHLGPPPNKLLEIDVAIAVCTMRAELIGHFEPCMTEIYLHIDARMADYIRTHP